MLELKQVNAGYGLAHILHGISLNVGRGEVVCLLGSNGAGKSTTLLTILGILQPMSGAIEFDGVSLDGFRTSEVVRKGIAIVPEGRRIFGPLTVAENLKIAAAIRNNPQASEEQMDLVLQLFPILKERWKQLGGTLSGGQQQMLAIARALMLDPKLLLMDEPSMGLSPIMGEQVFDIIGRICARGVSVLLVEQNAYASLSVATRGYVLQAGHIVFEGSAAELRDAPMVREAYL